MFSTHAADVTTTSEANGEFTTDVRSSVVANSITVVHSSEPAPDMAVTTTTDPNPIYSAGESETTISQPPLFSIDPNSYTIAIISNEGSFTSPAQSTDTPSFTVSGDVGTPENAQGDYSYSYSKA